MYTYSQSTGELLHNGVFVGTGYSGIGIGRNSPAEESVQNVGPIPRGNYIIGVAYADGHLGPVVMNLDPVSGTNTFGRSLFRIHGNNTDNDASHGCIILGPMIRKSIALSGDTQLTVI